MIEPRVLPDHARRFVRCARRCDLPALLRRHLAVGKLRALPVAAAADCLRLQVPCRAEAPNRYV